MKAAVIEKYGGPEVFKIKKVPNPVLKAGEVLIRNRASSVNPIDIHVREGRTRIVTGLFGEHIIGSDFSGTVLASKSEKYKEGDEVFGFLNAALGGAYAEQLIATETNLCHKPNNISFSEAASLPLVSCTAWQGMVYEGKLQNNQRVLVLGCTGGVGTVAVQIAKSFECKVFGTCSKAHMNAAKELGCDGVWAYDEEEVPKDVNFDLIFDASGKHTISDYMEQLDENAMFVSTKGGAESFAGAAKAIKDVSFHKQMKMIVVMPDADDLQKIKQTVDDKWLKPYVAETFPLEKISEAHAKAAEGGFVGKIVVEI
ncbi:MAG TPA: NAD(P)-dependent alcohol dehydrogenase [Anditalea sp.]|nr:NAD(P)-dependent alcohol dehydrogenase [Anditalea sp.]